MRKNLLLSLALGSATLLTAVAGDYKVTPRLSYTTSEDSTQILIITPKAIQTQSVSVLSGGKAVKHSLRTQAEGVTLATMHSSILKKGKNNFEVKITDANGEQSLPVTLEKLAPKEHEVKIDNLTGLIFTNDLPTIPSGFYCYSPIQKTLMDEEIISGMNLYSPYQNIADSTFADRLWYLDRAAELGYKVNYNLLSVAGGGGGQTPFDGKNGEERLALLDREINRVKDHPALLSWYIADEPDGQGIEPEVLEMIYARIKAIDPYHPISVVIMSAGPGRRFANSCDIIMCDHYPVPNSAACEVIDAVQGLRNELQYEKALWFVPQTFGGSEWWSREPNQAEIRMMTWGSTLAGARGFQAFIRHGLNGFPKNQYMWHTYTKACREIQELTPFFANAKEEPTNIFSSKENALVAKTYKQNGREITVVLNRTKEPVDFKIATELDAKQAYAIFDDYQTPLFGNTFAGTLEPFAVRAFLVITDKDEITALSGNNKQNNVSNMFLDPSFEWGYSVAANQPVAFYAGAGKDRGATYALDSRVAYHGKHSLRLTTPTQNGGVNLSSTPLPLQIGKSYIMSVWAKANKADLRKNNGKMTFQMNLGGFHKQEFELTDQWKLYQMDATYESGVADVRALMNSIQLLSPGTAWFDMMEVIPDMDFTVERIPNTKTFSVTMNNNITGSKIHYTLDGSEPTLKSPVYTEPLTITDVRNVKARVFQGSHGYGISTQQIAAHKAVGAKVTYAKPYTKYTAGGDNALTDGVVSPLRFTSGQWQGFIGNDMEVVIDLGEDTKINKITSQYFHSPSDWIAPPTKVEYLLSNDGVKFTSAKTLDLGQAKQVPTCKIPITAENINQTARYIKVLATGHGKMPAWHSHDDAWMFIDEIIVE